MGRRATFSALYLGVVLAAGVAALLRMAVQPGRANPIVFLVLLFFACASASLQVRLPGVDRTVSLSFAFSFIAITELPAGPAFFIWGAALLYEAWRVAEKSPGRAEIAFHLAQAAVSTWCTSWVFHSLSHRLAMERLLALGAAAVTYYGISTGASAIQLAVQTSRAPWKVWNEKFFWMGPLFLLVPVAAAIAGLLSRASGASERLLGLGLIFSGYRYVKHYFVRLHDSQDHARLLDEIRQRTIEALAVAIESKDGGTAGHLQRVRRHALLLAEKLGCSEVELRTLELGAVLHDVGKVGVPDYILGKPGRLTEHEFGQMAGHTRLGAQIVEKVDFPYAVGEIVLNHHEHWDGSGYPRGLCGPGIPRLARILSVVDCFDALVMDRPYRAAMPIDKAVEVLREQRGRIFDPEILDLFLEELPSFAADLEREIQKERARLLLDQTPVQQVKQNWLTDAEKNEMVHRHVTFEKLATSPEQLVLLYEMLQALGAGPDMDQGVDKTLQLLARVVPYEQAGIFTVQGEEFVLVQAQGIPHHCLGRLKIPLFHGALAQAAQAKRPILAPGPPSELTAGLHRYLLPTRSTLAVPLIADDRVHGVLTLCSSVAGQFDPDDAWFVGLLTDKLARAVAGGRETQKV